jgi:hypothetical protein
MGEPEPCRPFDPIWELASVLQPCVEDDDSADRGKHNERSDSGSAPVPHQQCGDSGHSECDTKAADKRCD